MTESLGNGKAPFKDPIPTVERISKLAERVLSGDIILPKFQRDFVWPRSKVIGLLDSIARNYPIGSILLWQSRQPLANERAIADLRIAKSRPDYPVNYLLDGQQRLSTICGSLYWKPGKPDSLWNVAYDLRSRKFVHLYTLDDPPLSQMPLRYLSDAATYFKRAGALDDSDHREEADRLFNRFADYMIAAVTLGDMSIKDIAPIFERINSTATPLTIVDLMRAATWDPGFDLRDAIDEVLDGLRSKNYHDLDQKTILRAVSAAAGLGFAADDIDKLRERSVNDLKRTMTQVEEGARRAVDFLTTHIGAPYPRSLPYTNQFAVLAELFRRSPAPSQDHFAAIERWFWRTTLSGYFGGWNTGDMGRDWREVKRFTAEPEASEIHVAKALPRDDVWKVTLFRANSAHSKMLALMMSHANPVDIVTGQRLELRKSLSWSNDREFHHFFPKHYLKTRKVATGKANCVANLILLSSASNIRVSNRPPSEYLKDIRDQVGEEMLISRLASVLVPKAAYEAALRDDFDSFIDARSARLHEGALRLVGEEGAINHWPAGAPVDPTETLVGDENT